MSIGVVRSNTRLSTRVSVTIIFKTVKARARAPAGTRRRDRRFAGPGDNRQVSFVPSLPLRPRRGATSFASATGFVMATSGVALPNQVINIG